MELLHLVLGGGVFLFDWFFSTSTFNPQSASLAVGGFFNSTEDSRVDKCRRIWISGFSNIDEIRQKLGSKYGIDVDEIKRITIANPNLLGRDDFSAKHGLRTVVEIVTPSGKTLLIVMRLVDSQNYIWKIRTARYLN